MSVEDIIFYAIVLAAIAVICFFGAVLAGTPKRKATLVHAPTRVPRVVQPRGTEPK